MLPFSVDPRAKMNVIGRQLPLTSSFTVEPTDCLRSTAVGRATAVPARRATAVVNFMFAARSLSGDRLKDVFVVRESDERGWSGANVATTNVGLSMVLESVGAALKIYS